MNENYATEKHIAAGNAMMEGRPSSVSERLESERKMLADRLAQVENMLDVLNQNPQTTAVLDALAKLGHRIY